MYDPLEEKQLLHVPVVGRIFICCRSLMVASMVVMARVKEATLATKSGDIIAMIVVL